MTIFACRDPKKEKRRELRRKKEQLKHNEESKTKSENDLSTAKDKEVSLLLSTKEEKVLRVKKRARADLEKEKEATNEIDGGEDGLGLDEVSINLANPINAILDNTLEVTSLFNIDSSGDDDSALNVESSGEGSGTDFEGSGDVFVAEEDLESLEENLVVDTDAGRVYGRYRASSGGTRVAEHLGVPYAGNQNVAVTFLSIC